jgi:hypothetical protein
MLPIMLSDYPLLFTAASALNIKLFKVDDSLLAINEDGEKTLFSKVDEDVAFTLIPEDETLQDKCARMLVSNVLTEIKERIQHPESFDFDAEQLQTAMKTRRFLSSVERYFINKE